MSSSWHAKRPLPCSTTTTLYRALQAGEIVGEQVSR